MDFSKFDNMVDLEGLKNDAKEASERGADFTEIPCGEYEVRVERLEMGETKDGSPKMMVWFKIVNGVYKGQMIFWNQKISKGFHIHLCNTFLRSLETSQEVTFDSFRQYAELMFEIEGEIKRNGWEYALEYGERNKFKTFKILERFEDSVPY